jgi:hypothetical protein
MCTVKVVGPVRLVPQGYDLSVDEAAEACKEPAVDRYQVPSFQTVVRVLTGQCCFAPTMLDSSYPTSNRGGGLWIAQDSKRKLARQSDRVCDCCVLGTCISLHAPRFGSILSVFKIHVDLAPVMI